MKLDHIAKCRTIIGGNARRGWAGRTTRRKRCIDSTYSLTLTVKNPCNDATLTIPTLTKNVDGTQIEVVEAREWGGQVIL